MVKRASEIDEYEMKPRDILNKCSVIFGPTNTGKTKIIQHMLWALRGHAEQVMVFSETEQSNGTYSKFVDKPLIHYKVTKDLLENIWQRQEILSALYKQANKIDILEGLFNKVATPTHQQLAQKVKKAREKAIKDTENIEDLGKREESRKSISEEYDEFLIIVYKSIIKQNIQNLRRSPISQAEKVAIKYINFNPNLVLVLDDCAAEFKSKEFKGCDVFKRIFYMGRHVKITTIISCQSPIADLDSSYRRNAHNLFFTTADTAFCFYDNQTNGARHLRKFISEVSAGVFVGYQRLAFIRDQNKFYRYTAANVGSFKFGSKVIQRYCNMVSNDSDAIDRSNNFYKYFEEDMPTSDFK